MPQNILINLKGKQLGDLRVLQKIAPKKKGGRPRWRCVCSCGRRITVSHVRLIHKVNHKTHCGCKRKGLPTLQKIEYHAWWDAKGRCHNKKHPSYPQYGAHGIRMCKEWRTSFKAFFVHMGPRPSDKYSLDRKDPFGNYEPGNVRWATTKTQARNKKGTKYIIHPIKKIRTTAAEAAEDIGMRYQTFRQWMIDRGEW